jgi:hypothetical protein
MATRKSRRAAAAPVLPQRDTVLATAALLMMAFLALTIDDRHVGLNADGRQMIRTAVALLETGNLGQATGRDFTIARSDGTAVSRFGMATSLLQLPAASLAPVVERAYGPGSSQALFLLVPWLAIGVAAAAAGRMTRMLGGSHVAVVVTVLLASLASPLASYAAMEFSEPVQAAALTVGLAAALAAAQPGGSARAFALLAGAAAGTAVLAKSSLIVSAPAVLLPLFIPSHPTQTRRLLSWAAVGACAPLALWAGFELARFGTLFGGYPDDGFTHPWLDGLWRLLVGPNRGLLWFWPALSLFVWSGRHWLGPQQPPSTTRAFMAASWIAGAHVAIAAGYWGWHGMEGWGPRLVVAAIPLMAPFAALAPVRRTVLIVVVGLGLLSNAPPLLQHPTPVATYVMNLQWPEIPEARRGDFPFYATAESPEGRPTVVPFERLERTPSANPWRLYWWFRSISANDDATLSVELQTPPWTEVLPSLVPPTPLPTAAARQIAPRPRLGFLGRSLTGSGGPYASVYLDALLDQVVLANQEGDIARALDLSSRRLNLSPDGEAAAWRLESLRRAGRADDAGATLEQLSPDTRRHPYINVVLALFDREAQNPTRARALLASVVPFLPGTPAAAVVDLPVDRWPSTLDGMTALPRRDAAVSGRR